MYLKCSYAGMTSLNVSNNALLKLLECNNNNLTSLDVSNNPNLIYLDCLSNNLAELNLYHAGSSKLWYLCTSLKSSTIDLSNQDELTYCTFASADVTSLDFRNNKKLKYLHLQNCSQLTSVNLKGIEALERLQCNNDNLQALDVSDCINLVILECPKNKIRELDLSKNTKLEALNCSNNELVGLDFSNNNLLKNRSSLQYEELDIDHHGYQWGGSYVNFSYTNQTRDIQAETGYTLVNDVVKKFYYLRV